MTNAFSTDAKLTPLMIEEIAERKTQVWVGPLSDHHVAECENFAKRLIADGHDVYGWTTGFGPLVVHEVPRQRAQHHQASLLAHLASGTGEPLPRRHIRAIMASRLWTLCRGRSAVRSEVVRALASALNADFCPVVPSQGTVGASGDLTPLAHIALALVGEGEAWDGEKRRSAQEVLNKLGLRPLTLQGRDGLALVNGTSAMTGIAALNAQEAQRALELAIVHAAAYSKVMLTPEAAFDERLGRVRPHAGQAYVHRQMKGLLGDQPRHLADDEALQDAYSMRCAPQILGAVADAMSFHEQTVETELDSVTDNPVFLPEDGTVLHGGNFQGQHIAFGSDALANAVIKIAELVERRIARVTDVQLNRGLPAFLSKGTPGIDSGFMGAQVTASSLVAEMRTKATPASVQSIPTNGNNQDIVSMGTIAARKASILLADCYHILAIEAIVLAQAVDIRFEKQSMIKRNTGLERWYRWVRDRSLPLEQDRPLASEIATIAKDCHNLTIKQERIF